MAILIKSPIHNQRVLLGYKKPAEVIKVQFDDKVYEENHSDSETVSNILNLLSNTNTDRRRSFFSKVITDNR
jgi:hypothetical protein